MIHNVKFPETDLVECVFSLRANNTLGKVDTYDEFDHSVETNRLKRYVYKVPASYADVHGRKPAVGDFVVVHCQTGYQIAEVVSINCFAADSIHRRGIAPVVCPVSLDCYWNEIERQRLVQSLKIKLDEEKKRLEALVTYDLLAEKSPEFKKLLDAYKDAGGSF